MLWLQSKNYSIPYFFSWNFQEILYTNFKKYIPIFRLNPASLFFAGFTTVFLGMRGIQHHNFYLEKFKEDYPKGRRAVIPYLVWLINVN